jgi:hypothetical protein
MYSGKIKNFLGYFFGLYGINGFWIFVWVKRGLAGAGRLKDFQVFFVCPVR